SVSDLFRPHYEHWVTLPIVMYRMLWWIFGARTYLPYQLLVVTGHLTIAALLRDVMRRVGVGPWTSTAAAGLFALFGAGYDNMFSAFQITFVGSVAFGLVQLGLADHDGCIDRRDWFGLAAGLAALMCSLVGVPMVMIAGLATLIRRGWRAVLFHVVPLACVFAGWWLIAGEVTYAGHHDLAQTMNFVRLGFTATFDALGQVPFLGVVVAIGLVVGLALAWAGLRGKELRRKTAMPAALLVGAIAFLAITGWGRSGQGNGPAIVFGPEHARVSRYLHVVAALLLPALAVAACALMRQWRLLTPVIAGMLVIPIARNVKTMDDERPTDGPGYVAYRRMLLAVPQFRRIAEFPRDFAPDPAYSSGVTVGWLVDNARSGKIPKPEPELGSPDIDTEMLIMALPPIFTATTTQTKTCTVVHDAVNVHLEKDDVISVEGPSQMQYVAEDESASRPASFNALIVPPYGPQYRSLIDLRRYNAVGPMTVRITPVHRRTGA